LKDDLSNLPEARKATFRKRLIASCVPNSDGCWIWQKSRMSNGYGRFSLGGGRDTGAHRMAHLIFKGKIPAGYDVCHRCDVRPCVNPDHLFAGTRSENIMDASRKNRVSRTHQCKGSAQGSAKLDESKVVAIFALLKSGESQSSIARKYGVTQRVISLISRREAWKHVRIEE
jgi:HNH endonuclease